MEEDFEKIHHVKETEVVCQFCGSVELIQTEEEDVWALTWYCSNWCYHQMIGVIA